MGERFEKGVRERVRENACVYVCVNAILCGMPDRKRMEKGKRERQRMC